MSNDWTLTPMTGFAGPTPTISTYRAAAGAGVRRAGTIVRSPLEARRERKEQVDGDMSASDVWLLCPLLNISDAYFIGIRSCSRSSSTYGIP